MPSLHLFGRRWAVGSDDFVFPMLTASILRGVWAISVAIFYYFVFQSSTQQSVEPHEVKCARFAVRLFLLLFIAINVVVRRALTDEAQRTTTGLRAQSPNGGDIRQRHDSELSAAQKRC